MLTQLPGPQKRATTLFKIAKFKYYGKKRTNQNCIHEEIKSRFISENTFYGSVKNLVIFTQFISVVFPNNHCCRINPVKWNNVFSSHISYMFRPNIIIISLTVRMKIQMYIVVKFYVLLTMHLDIIVLRKSNLMHNLFLVYFIKLFMFRAYLCTSSGGKTTCIQQLVLSILFR